MRPAAPRPGQRERVHHRPGPRLQVKVVEAAQHALAVRPGRGRVRPADGFPVTGLPLRPAPHRAARTGASGGLAASWIHRQKSRVILSPASGRGSDLRGCVEVTVLDAAAAVFRFFA